MVVEIVNMIFCELKAHDDLVDCSNQGENKIFHFSKANTDAQLGEFKDKIKREKEDFEKCTR